MHRRLASRARFVSRSTYTLEITPFWTLWHRHRPACMLVPLRIRRGEDGARDLAAAAAAGTTLRGTEQNLAFSQILCIHFLQQ